MPADGTTDTPPPAAPRTHESELARTDPHSAEEIEGFLTGTDSFDPRNYEGPPTDDRGAFEYKPDVPHIDGPPVDSDGNLAHIPDAQERKLLDADVPPIPPDSPADAAALHQGDLATYAGTDSWRDTTAHAGDCVWFGAAEAYPSSPPDGYADKAISGYGVPEGELPAGWEDTALSARLPTDGTDPAPVTFDAQEYNEGTQVKAGGPDSEYKGYLHCYEFQQDHAVAEGVAKANTQYGEGGTPQMYITDVQQAIRDGELKYVGQVPLANITPSERIKYM
jgi:hypothetical protein